MSATATLYDRMLRSFASCHGIRVCPIGEDETIFVALGHEDPKRVLQAFNTMARSLVWVDVLDGDGRRDSSIWQTRVLDRFERTWAIVTDNCGDLDSLEHKESSCDCEQIQEADWWLEWAHSPSVPGAFAVTIWRSW
jgi:hypothetical protein